MDRKTSFSWSLSFTVTALASWMAFLGVARERVGGIILAGKRTPSQNLNSPSIVDVCSPKALVCDDRPFVKNTSFT